jgi:hypothetical protein
VTGTLTDIGIEVAGLLLGQRPDGSSWKIKILAYFTAGFFVGGCLGAIASLRAPHAALYYPGLLYLAMAATNDAYFVCFAEGRACGGRGRGDGGGAGPEYSAAGVNKNSGDVCDDRAVSLRPVEGHDIDREVSLSIDSEDDTDLRLPFPVRAKGTSYRVI